MAKGKKDRAKDRKDREDKALRKELAEAREQVAALTEDLAKAREKADKARRRLGKARVRLNALERPRRDDGLDVVAAAVEEESGAASTGTEERPALPGGEDVPPPTADAAGAAGGDTAGTPADADVAQEGVEPEDVRADGPHDGKEPPASTGTPSRRGRRTGTTGPGRTPRAPQRTVRDGAAPVRRRRSPSAAPAPAPLDGYDGLSVAALRSRLPQMDRPQLESLLAYERAHKQRASLLGVVERLLRA